MGQLRDRMAADLQLAGYQPSTTRNYLHHVHRFAKHYRRSPTDMGEPEVRDYMQHLLKERKIGPSTYIQVRAALIFLYAKTLMRPVEVASLPTRRRRKRLPEILSREEVASIFAKTASKKHCLIFKAMYSAGLRIAEACGLRTEHIDSKRGVIRVVAGKGGRDRYTLLSERFLDELREYWVEKRPGSWLFPGQCQCKPIHPGSVRLVFREAMRLAGIKRTHFAPHVLRHCFATHLLEGGTGITTVQALLGHSELRTTSIYVHMSDVLIAKTKSPLDLLSTSKGTAPS
jgi:integrase/recombinase XerD